MFLSPTAHWCSTNLWLDVVMFVFPTAQFFKNIWADVVMFLSPTACWCSFSLWVDVVINILYFLLLIEVLLIFVLGFFQFCLSMFEGMSYMDSDKLLLFYFLWVRDPWGEL